MSGRFRPSRILALLASLTLAAACSGSPANLVPLSALTEFPSEQAKDAAGVEARLTELRNQAIPTYTLKPGDQVEVNVWGVPELSRSVQVRPDGYLNYLLVGELPAEGRNLTEIERELSSRLARYVREPRVSVLGTSFSGNTLTMLGAFKSPGRHSFNGRLRVLDALAIAGGLETPSSSAGGIKIATITTLADLKRAWLMRGGEVLPVDFYELMVNKDMDHNIPVMANDLIYIPTSEQNRVYVLGEVGSNVVLQFGSRLTFVEAMAQAGGADPTAGSWTHVYLVRGTLVDPKVAYVNVGAILTGQARDFDLAPGDIVYVAPTYLTTANRVVGQIVPLLSSVVTAQGSKTAAENF